MIDKNFFFQQIEEALILSSHRMSQRQLNLIYDKIYRQYENDDFRQALSNLIATSEKLNYYLLVREMDKYAYKKREVEREKERQQEEYRNKQFWRENYNYIKQGMCNRKCISCLVQYCDIIHIKAVQAIKGMLNKEKTLEQVNIEMAKEFEGWLIGFGEDPF